MNRKDIIDLYADDEPEIMFADGYDKAIAGVTWDGERTRVVYETEKILKILMERDNMSYDEAIAGVVWDGERTRVVYTTEKILAILMERDAMTYDEASEFFDFNVAGSYMGVYTPLYLET